MLSYDGGLVTSAAIPWLAEYHNAEIVAVTLDLGQGRELEEIRDRALATGAVRAHVVDGREEFARDYILPALQAGALYEGRYPMATALGRPLIAKKLVELAGIEQAPAIAHGCTARGNDQMRIDTAVRALNPAIRVIAPARDWGMTREDEIEYVRRRNVPVPAAAASPYRTDTNLWGRSIECGALDNPWVEPIEDIYTMTKAPADAPNAPAYVEINFERGVPVAVTGVPMALPDLIESLSIIAGQHGVGRLDRVEKDVIGVASREIYEAPAAVVLHTAHKELEMFVSSSDLERLKQHLSARYADLIYNGLWFTPPMREALDAFNARVQEEVTGVVRIRLFKGRHTVVGRTSPNALYRHGPAYDAGDLRPLEAAARHPRA